jgi:uncharacterized protein (DUF4415 family)
MTPTPKAPAKRRGRPPSGKILVTLRLDPAVVAAFKAGGPGWQSRINDTLADIVKFDAAVAKAKEGRA